MNNTVMVRTDDHLIIGIVVQAFHIVINVVRFRDVRAVLLANHPPAKLASIAIQELKVFPNLAVQLSDPRHSLVEDITRFGIRKIIIKV